MERMKARSHHNTLHAAEESSPSLQVRRGNTCNDDLCMMLLLVKTDGMAITSDTDMLLAGVLLTFLLFWLGEVKMCSYFE